MRSGIEPETSRFLVGFVAAASRWERPCILDGNVKWCLLCEKQSGDSLKSSKQSHLCPGHLARGVCPRERIQTRISQGSARSRVQGRFIHSRQVVDATSVSVDRWTDDQNRACTCSGILLSLQKDGDPVMCHHRTHAEDTQRETSQSQKDTSVKYPKKFQTLRSGEWNVVTRGRGGQEQAGFQWVPRFHFIRWKVSYKDGQF